MHPVTMIDKARKGPAYLFLLLILTLTIIFRDAVISIFQSWQTDEYSYGYLIPFLSLILILNKLGEQSVKSQSSWLGLGIVVIGLLAQFAFQFAGVRGVLPQIYLLSLIGLTLTFFGAQMLWKLLGPLSLLFFATPLPKFFYYKLSFTMQMMSSSLGAFCLSWIGIPVFQDGNIIDLGNYKLQVAEACSGLRYLFPLLALSFLIAYLYKTSFWKRAVLFLSALPISILMNSLRIAVIGITVDRWGSAMAEGLLHEFEGWVVFAGCFFALLLEIAALQRIGRKGGDIDFDDIGIPKLKSLQIPAIGKPGKFCALALIFSLLLSFGVPQLMANRLQPVPLHQSLAEFPIHLGSWIGHPQKLDGKSLEVLGTDDYFIADYTKEGEPAVNFYMLYYPKQDSTSNQAVHNPTVCLPGGGWMIEDLSTKTLNLHSAGDAEPKKLTVNRIMISKNNEREIVYYWFVQDGQITTTSSSETRLAMVKNAIFKGRTNGAMMRVLTTVAPAETEEKAEERLSTFLNQALQNSLDYMFTRG